MVLVSDSHKFCILNKDLICEILPHRGRALLLDEVEKNTDSLAGYFLVTFEVCEGHSVFNGQKIIRGVDLIEMSAQLLGIGAWFLLKEKGLTVGKTLLRRFGECRFIQPVFPGQRVTSTVQLKNLEVRNIRDLGAKVVGRDFNIYEGSFGKLVDHISFIELFITS
jgi:3-hydroxymyristoyl/3-hydroxydecanoyl-(acyl carrier protein) dehydratase